MHRCRRQEATDRDLSIGPVDVQAVAGPLFHSSFAVVFSSDIAVFRKIINHLVRRHFMSLFEDPPLFALLSLGFSAFRFRFFAGFDRGRVAAYMTDQPIRFPVFNKCFMKSLWKLGRRKLCKRSREGRLARNLSSTAPSTQPSRRRRLVKIVDQRPSIREIQHRLCYEGPRQRPTVRPWSTPASPPQPIHVILERHKLHDHRKTLQSGRQRTHSFF